MKGRTVTLLAFIVVLLIAVFVFWKKHEKLKNKINDKLEKLRMIKKYIRALGNDEQVDDIHTIIEAKEDDLVELIESMDT